jgi:hypothetical protein
MEAEVDEHEEDREDRPRGVLVGDFPECVLLQRVSILDYLKTSVICVITILFVKFFNERVQDHVIEVLQLLGLAVSLVLIPD